MTNFAIETTISDTKRKSVVPIKSLTKDKVGAQNLKDFLADFKTQLIDVARDTLRKEKAQGFDKMPRVRVDNAFDKPVESVKPFGKIEFFARVSSLEALVEVWDLIQKRIIKSTGEMSRSNVVMVNNVVVARSRQELVAYLAANSQNLTGGTKIVFLNTAPYARKLERLGYRAGRRGFGSTRKTRKTKSGRRGNLITAPNGAYYLSFRRIRSSPKTKSIANFFRFQYITGGSLGGAIPNDGRRRTFSSNFNSEGRAGRPYLYPAIVFELSQAGLALGTGGNTSQVFTG